MNLYFWDQTNFNEGFRFSGCAIAMSTNKESAIANILNKIKEENADSRPSTLAKMIEEAELELRSTDPVVNPLAILVYGGD